MSDPEPAEAEDPTSGPERTCIVCRATADRDDLVRIVALPDGTAGVDWRNKLPGRGAWVHPTTACIAPIDAEPRRLDRALKASVRVVTPLLAQARAMALAGTLDGLSMASAAGALVGGHDVLEEALKQGRINVVVVANDASPRTIESLAAAAGPDVPFVTLPLGREALGQRIGRGSRAALGVTSSRAAHHLRAQLRRVRSLG